MFSVVLRFGHNVKLKAYLTELSKNGQNSNSNSTVTAWKRKILAQGVRPFNHTMRFPPAEELMV